MRRLRFPAPSQRQAGAAAVEFALLFPLFMLIVFGIIDMGFAFNQKINLTQAAREASRYGATLSVLASHKTGPTLDGNVGTWLDAVSKVAIDAGGEDLATSRPNRYVCVAYINTTDAVTQSLTVGSGGPATSSPCYSDGRTDNRVQVVLRSDTALDFLLFGGEINVGSQSVTHFEAVPT